MKQILVTYDNESWIFNLMFGVDSFVCTKLGGYSVKFIPEKDIKIIARPKKQTCA